MKIISWSSIVLMLLLGSCKDLERDNPCDFMNPNGKIEKQIITDISFEADTVKYTWYDNHRITMDAYSGGTLNAKVLYKTFICQSNTIQNELEVYEKGILIDTSNNFSLDSSVWTTNNDRQTYFTINSLKMNTKYFIKGYIKTKNNKLADSDREKYLTVYTDTKVLQTKFHYCADFTTENKFNNSGWISKNFWVSGNPHDNQLNNDWTVTGESSIEKTFYDLPQGLRLTLYHSTLTKNQTLEILVNDISLLNITDKLYGDLSLAMPGGNLKVKIIVNDNDTDASKFVAINGVCIE
jgi:hypothetical protein